LFVAFLKFKPTKTHIYGVFVLDHFNLNINCRSAPQKPSTYAKAASFAEVTSATKAESADKSVSIIFRFRIPKAKVFGLKAALGVPTGLVSA